jgi:hypothetical protein
MTEPTNETIVLHDVSGFARKSGTDIRGNQWLEFDVDYFAEQEKGICSICGTEIEFGWLCLDGGEEVCHNHITY